MDKNDKIKNYLDDVKKLAVVCEKASSDAEKERRKDDAYFKGPNTNGADACDEISKSAKEIDSDIKKGRVTVDLKSTGEDKNINCTPPGEGIGLRAFRYSFFISLQRFTFH